jgi:hypothetical protein
LKQIKKEHTDERDQQARPYTQAAQGIKEKSSNY